MNNNKSVLQRLFLFNKTNRCTIFSEFILVKKLYVFRAVPLPIIRRSPLYIRHSYMSSDLHDIYQCRMYSGELLMMGRRTARNMWGFLKNKFGKIGASVGFIKMKFVTMHGHMDIKYRDYVEIHCSKYGAHNL